MKRRQILELFYGWATAGEIAYFAYIYVKVKIKVEDKMYKHTKDHRPKFCYALPKCKNQANVQVDKSEFSRVTSYTRAALLLGRFLSYVVSAPLILTGWTDYQVYRLWRCIGRP